MKKIITLFILTSLLCGCSKDEEKTYLTGNSNNVSEVIQEQIDEYNAEAETKNDADVEAIPEKENNEDITKIDVDLSYYSSTVIFGKINEMAENYQDYMGKTVKTKGVFNQFENPYTNFYYFVCIVQDNTACCSSGFEFVLKDEYVFPDDYPQEGSTITVTGVFDTYVEGNPIYIYLRDAEFCYDE